MNFSTHMFYSDQYYFVIMSHFLWNVGEKILELSVVPFKSLFKLYLFVVPGTHITAIIQINNPYKRDLLVNNLIVFTLFQMLF